LSPPAKKLPGEGFLGWLGRQVGYVSGAIRQPVADPTTPANPSVDAPAGAQTIYRDEKVVEQPMPGRPDVLLRRTVIDEAVVKNEKD
jgi:hypothetical protein